MSVHVGAASASPDPSTRRAREIHAGRLTRDSACTIVPPKVAATYEGQATGETFNRSGKTDILVRVEDRNA